MCSGVGCVRTTFWTSSPVRSAKGRRGRRKKKKGSVRDHELPLPSKPDAFFRESCQRSYIRLRQHVCRTLQKLNGLHRRHPTGLCSFRVMESGQRSRRQLFESWKPQAFMWNGCV